MLLTRDQGIITSVGASPDGAKLAVTVQTDDELCLSPPPGASAQPCTRSLRDVMEIVVIDARTGDELLRLAQSDAKLASLTGAAQFPVWEASGDRFVVQGVSQGEQPGNRAVIDLSGSVVMSDILDYTVPTTGGYMATGTIEPCESLNLRRHELRIVDVESGRTVARVADPGRVFFPFELSPDGGELLYVSEAYPGGPSDTSCRWDNATAVWSVLATSGTVTDNVDIAAVHRRWYGTGAVAFECAPDQADPGGYCLSPTFATKASVNGETIAEGTDIRVLSRSYTY